MLLMELTAEDGWRRMGWNKLMELIESEDMYLDPVIYIIVRMKQGGG
jgi:hypothetical protein